MRERFFLTILFFSGFIQAQYQNLLTAKDSTAIPTKTLYLGISDLAFVKNNEYFNLIADGYTLLGNQINLDIHYRPHQNYQISAGIFLQKYFGRSEISQLIPYFGLEIYKDNSTFYIGKLYTADNHLLVEELYDFERHLDSRSVENGLQHRYISNYWQTDTWLEWEHFIFKGDRKRERLNFGQSTVYRQNFGKWQWRPFVQVYLMHRGGQINLRSANNQHINNAMVIANYAAGMSWQYRLNKHSALGIDYTFLGHSINSENVEELHFRSGNAHKIRFFFNYKHWQNYAGYWQARKFVAPKGNAMFQSISSRIDNYLNEQGEPVAIFKNHTEPNRRLLTWTSVYENEIYSGLHLGFVVDLYYQLNKSSVDNPYYNSQVEGQFDYAAGLYLLYRFDFKLTD